jgi:hypothetical protein
VHTAIPIPAACLGLLVRIEIIDLTYYEVAEWFVLKSMYILDMIILVSFSAMPITYYGSFEGLFTPHDLAWGSSPITNKKEIKTDGEINYGSKQNK